MPVSGDKLGVHAAWAMAVGGMIGGGIYTLVGVLIGLAGPLSWLSVALGGAIALATVDSYARLALDTGTEGVPVTVLELDGRRSLAGVLAWWLLLVYVLALAVYTFTVGHYLGNALGLTPIGIALIEAAIVGALTALDLRHIRDPAIVQIVAVWVELALLAALAIAGFVHWNPANLTRGVPAGSLLGVLRATAMTFIAFEGFEMLAYDLREMRRPRRVMRLALTAAVIAVALAYGLVTVGAASLIGGDVLVAHRDNALAFAGRAAAGSLGLVIVTIAACASAISAINATLFSASRLARASAERRLLPDLFARGNRFAAPVWSTVGIALAATVLAAVMSLEPLIGTASLGFLALFCLVNVLAFRRSRTRRWISLAGALGAGLGVCVVVVELARGFPVALVVFVVVAATGALLYRLTARA